MKSVRFSQVIEACGPPRVHTLWLAPEQDPELKRARETQRVMTVKSEPGKADWGLVGFEPPPGQNTEVLIFPKSLRRFARARIIGLKFDLLAQPPPKPLTSDFWSQGSPRRTTGKRAKPERRADTPPSTAEVAAAAPPPAKKMRAAAPDPVPPANALQQAVRSALKELKAGKAVAAYQRLERALAAAQEAG